ncbi:nuclear transport factor 2 family protein [Bradyrhizobium oligotrophicum]|uniref:nuclear transport factor 2 family protein n=2 Tax=Bradyrhizobium oligotrophicum TaxID=44255 RepID=UPI003EBF1E3D
MQGSMGHREAEAYVRRLFACIDAQDWAGLSSLLDDGAVYERPGYEPFVGKLAIMQFYRQERIVASGEHLLEQVLSNGEQIACWGSFTGRDKDGHPLKARFADVYHLSAGRIGLRRTFFDSPAL